MTFPMLGISDTIELMPRRNVFIRKEDLEAWDTMPDRPKWLHKRLQEYKNGHMGYKITDEILPETPLVQSESPVQLPPIIAGIDDSE